jgi:hypothetical protein
MPRCGYRLSFDESCERPAGHTGPHLGGPAHFEEKPVSDGKAIVQNLRQALSDVCLRPNKDYTLVCIKEMGHEGDCGLDNQAEAALQRLKNLADTLFPPEPKRG